MSQEIDFEKLSAMIKGGIYYERLPGRGIAIRREYRPMAEEIIDGFTRFGEAIKEAAESMAEFIKVYEEKRQLFEK